MNTRTLIAIPYELTRAPLWVIDTQLVQRLPRDSFPRLAFDRALGSYDQFAGRLLANDDIVRLGIDRATRSEMLTDAIGLERGAAKHREEADETAAAGRESAQQKRAAAQHRMVDGVHAAETTEQQGKRVAVANARQQATKQKQAAQQRAERRTATIRERLAQKDKAADTRQATARRTASAKLDDAAAAKAAARRTRSDANKLGTLADAKKAGRKK